MREIKFRAWLKEGKKMVEVQNICFDTKDISYKEDIGLIRCEEFENIELMQFTGLYDKKKKEIYEGDIVCFKGSYYVVKYFSEYGRFAISDNIVQDSLPMVIGNPGNYEVVGNICDNIGLV